MPEQVEAIVIGGGQAGLAISSYLTQQGRTHVVLEQAAQVVPAWRHGRWDSFTLVTPNWSALSRSLEQCYRCCASPQPAAS